MLGAGIAESDIQTSGYSLGTVREDLSAGDRNTKKAPIFVASNTVTVNLNDTADVKPVPDTAIQPGQIPSRIFHSTFRTLAPRRIRPWPWPYRMPAARLLWPQRRLE